MPTNALACGRLAVEAFPPYEEYRNKTSRTIPVFIAEPV